MKNETVGVCMEVGGALVNGCLATGNFIAGHPVVGTVNAIVCVLLLIVFAKR